MLKEIIAAALADYCSPLTGQQILDLLEFPPNDQLGDVAFPCFALSKTMKQSPNQIAVQLADSLPSGQWTTEAAGPYLNFKFNRAAIAEQLAQDGGARIPEIGNGKRVIIDMSSPNIAKPFGIGHLRSTMIGNALYNLLRKVGYDTVNVNHLGDWGTQFGKMITAYLHWGNPADKADDPIKAYLELYVRFHEEAKLQPDLETEAREWFVKLEAADPDARRYWSMFIEDSLAAFNKLYDRLGVSFDHYLGESFYNDKMDAVVEQLSQRGLLEESDGALVVRLDDEGLPPCIIKKSDGSSIYATRDLATAIYRQEQMGGEELLYVVGAEQSLHFRQLFLVLERMGYGWADQCKHIPFGLMLMDGQKMSTRRGKVVFLEDVLDEAAAHALRIIEEKNPSLSGKAEVAEAVGVGAVIFGDLLHSRQHEVNFSLEDVVNFEGETGPYVQYTYARTQSLLRKAGCSAGIPKELEAADFSHASGDYAWQLVKALLRYPEVLAQAAARYEPSVVARYLIDLAQTFNRFYHHEKIITGYTAEQDAKLALVQLTAECLEDGLKLLGLKALKEM
ncbi:arginine--tRNA ligase [Paenibacillus glycanilyticus]|uniref:Arginine--tRNA ligase n=1 Tax=Paenibacillus glycanilyticus TaxID=126569 RepID=A0ABQ6GID9_9BACL|nr:arginine--tRNA ligase [Paenibacillus glycanilyticus]GLX68827.1 arginine--tRNA ligase 1 [Paenibacillus glycanilyticus]